MRYLHTMVRVSDLDESLRFYCEGLGLKEISRMDSEKGRFTLIFLATPEDVEAAGYPGGVYTGSKIPEGLPCVELTHNWGTEDDPEFSYHNGNEDPRGFGHIGFAVPDLEAACARFEELGVSFVKRPQDGKMHNIAFIRDPDGYWIEIFAPGGMA